MSKQAEKPTAVRIDLTEAQEARVAAALEESRVAAGPAAAELTIEELEQRIAPRLAAN